MNKIDLDKSDINSGIVIMQEPDNRIYYDYKNQAWVMDGRYVSCNHPPEMNCKCFGRLHHFEKVV